MMLKRYSLQFFSILGLFFLLPLFLHVFAQSLSFDPATVTVNSGQTFDVKINVNTGSNKSTSVDAYILYDKALLQPQSVKDGSFFSTTSKYLSQDGRAYVAGMVDDPSSAKSGTGTIAIITFKAVKEGTAALTFDCTSGATNDSNISKDDANATDMIQCGSNGKATVTIGTGGGGATGGGTGGGTNPTPTLPAYANPTPTSAAFTPLAVATPTPGQLMRSGVFENVLKFAIPGAGLLLIAMVVKLLLK